MKVFLLYRLAFFLVLAVGFSCSILVSGNAAAGDWPQWRGPDRDGRSADTGLLQKWPDGGPKLVWKATGLGIGYTGVSVAGDRVYAMGDLENASQLIALNRADGQILWKTKVGKAGAPGWGGFAGPRCTPTVDDKLVFAVSQFGQALSPTPPLERKSGARITARTLAGGCPSGDSAECPWWTAKTLS